MATGIAIPADIDVEQMDYEGLDSGGMPEPGRYHVRLVSVESQDDGSNTPSENLTFLILNGTTPHQQGKKIIERIYHHSADGDAVKTEKAVKRAMGIGKRMGVYTDADLKAGNPVDYSAAEGKEFIIDIEDSSYTGKDGKEKKASRMGYMGIYQKGDPRVADCPLGNGAGGTRAPVKGNAANTKASHAKPAANTNRPARPPARQPAQAAASVDEL